MQQGISPSHKYCIHNLLFPSTLLFAFSVAWAKASPPHSWSQSSANKSFKDVTEQHVQNVLWKLQAYLPSALTGVTPRVGATPYVKVSRQHNPDLPTVRLAPRLGDCPYGKTVELTSHGEVKKLNFASPFGGPGTANDIGHLVFTLHAGIQRGLFEETKCDVCKRFFLGCWSFRKNASDGKKNYGYRTNTECMGVDAGDQFFFMPGPRRLYKRSKSN